VKSEYTRCPPTVRDSAAAFAAVMPLWPPTVLSGVCASRKLPFPVWS
jgi:hypothetical protein